MKKMILFLAMAVLGFSTAAQAALYIRGTDDVSGNRLIYDDDLNITWYDYTNTASSWWNQMNWASNLSVSFGSQTYNDWRLPSTVDGAYSWGYDGTTSAGYNITSSEMGHLFYTALGNKGSYDTAGNSQSGWGLANTGPFEHLQAYVYWSGTEYSLSTDRAWHFDTYYGYHYVSSKGLSANALAVRPGDVGAAPVPEPGTWMLLGSGLAGMAAFRKRFALK